MTAITMDRPGEMPQVVPSTVGIEATPPMPILSEMPAASTRTDTTINVLLVEELAEVAGRVRELLSTHEDIHLTETVTDGASAFDRIREFQPDVIVIDVLMQGAVNGLQIANKVRSSGLSTPILLLTVPKMPIALSEEMGIVEVQDLPLQGEDFIDSIVRMDEKHRGPIPVKPAGTFVVFSGKGGVGRTTIAQQIATAMAGRGGARVALVDGDLHHGDLRLMLDAPDDAPSIVQLPTDHIQVDELREIMWTAPSGVDVLLAPQEMEEADMVSPRELNGILNALLKTYDAVVIDAPTAVSENTLAMLDRADIVIDVVTPDHAVLRQARRCHRAFDAAAMPLDKHVFVLNRADASGPSAAEVSAELGRQLEATIPEHPSMADEMAANAEVSPAFDHLATLVAEKAAGVEGRSEAAA